MGFTKKKTIFLAATISTTNFLRFSEKNPPSPQKIILTTFQNGFSPCLTLHNRKIINKKNKHYSLVKEFIGTTTDKKMEQK